MRLGLIERLIGEGLGCITAAVLLLVTAFLAGWAALEFLGR